MQTTEHPTVVILDGAKRAIARPLGIVFVYVCVWGCSFAVPTFAAEPRVAELSRICGPTGASAVKIVEEMLREFNKSNAATIAGGVGFNDHASYGRFADKDIPFDAIICTGYPKDDQQRILIRQFANGNRPKAYLLGVRELAVIVHAENPVNRLNCSDIGDLLEAAGKGMTWQKFGGGSAAIRCYVETNTSWSRELLRRTCMYVEQAVEGGVRKTARLFRDDLIECVDADEILRKVDKDRSAIGFIPYSGQALKGAKVVPISMVALGKCFIPRCELSREDMYPLKEPLLLCIHPKAPVETKEFALYCVGARGAEIAARHGLITQHRLAAAIADERVIAMRAGKGTPLAAFGIETMQVAFQELAVEYVRSRAVIQPRFSTVGAHGSTAGESIIDEKRIFELLLVDARPNWQALDQNGKKWGGLDPPEARLTARGTVVIVHSLNALEVLRTEHVRELFGSKVRSWRNHSGVDAEIHRYAPFTADPAAKLFYEKVLPLSQCGAITRKKTSAEVIAALALDPQGIAFVDYTAIPKDNKSIKVLGIVTDKGIVYPEPRTILDGSWPISQQYYLYVNPKASDTAKDFAKFIVSGACAEVFRKHGMVPAPPQKIEFPTTQPPATATQPAGK